MAITQTPTTATAPLGSTARTNQLLVESSKQTGIATPSFSTPTQVSNAVSNSLATPSNPTGNPKDAIGYTPGTLPGDKVNNTQTTTQPLQSIAQTTQNNTSGGTATSTPSGIPGMPDLTGSTSDQASQAIDQLKAKYGQALSDLTKSGVESPSNPGAASAGIKAAINTQPQVDAQAQEQQKQTQQTVDSFLNPTTNPQIADSIQSLREIVSPQSERNALDSAMSQLTFDKSNLAGLQGELMNVKNIMAGTQQDIADEVTKAGGTVSASLLANMTVARNKALLAQSQQIQEQIQGAQNIVATDTSLVGDAKAQVSENFTQNMSLLNYEKSNQSLQLSAAKDSLDAMQKSEGWDGIYQAALNSGDPTAIDKINATMGPNFSLAEAAKGAAQTRAIDNEKTASQLASDKANIQKQNEDNGVPNPTKAGQAGYTDTGVKYTSALAQQEIDAKIKSEGLVGTRGLLDPATYNSLEGFWASNNLPASDFKAIYGRYIDQSKKTQYN